MTTKLPATYYLPLWEQAEQEEIGLLIRTDYDSMPNLVKALYACKQEVGGFEDLILFQPQPPGTIYLARKTVEVPE